ncbi:MAG: hypothetical protein SEPTF4163_006507 [Sporothrix epigloea]
MAFAWPDGEGAVARDAATNAFSAAKAALADAQNVATNRKAFLMSLVSELTLDEIWMLQERLAKLDLRTDIFARLPPELQLIVCECLGPADLGCCLLVSRLWRGSFLHESVRKGTAQRCFPSLLEYADAVWTKLALANPGHANGDNEDANRRNMGDLVDTIFTETARRYAMRSLGRFRRVFRHCLPPPLKVAQSATATTRVDITTGELTWLNQGRPIAKRQRERQEHTSHDHVENSLHAEDIFTKFSDFSLEAEIDEEEELSRDCTPYFHGPDYAYGHVAWQCLNNGATWFLVDDLRTGRRKPFRVPNDSRRGESYLLVGFGDELLVATCGISMLAWNFVTGEQQTKQLPAGMDTAQTLGKRICILAAGRVYVWTFGGLLAEADTTGLDKKHLEPDVDGRIPGFFILDPVNDGVFYLGDYELDVGQMGRDGVLRFHLHMFEDLKYQRTYSDHLDFYDFALPRYLIESAGRRNARGLYSLASWRVGPGAPGPMRSVSPHAVAGVASLAFNIYTKTFSLSFFSLPPASHAYGPEDLQPIRGHIWNDQLIAIMSHCDDAAKGRVQRAKPLLFAFDDEYSESARCSTVLPFSSVPLYTSSFDDGSTESVQEQGDNDTCGAEESTTIIPEFRKKVRFDELCPLDTPGRWLQDEVKWAEHQCRLRFALDIDIPPSKAAPHRPAHVKSHHILGDDDFLLFRHGNEYTIWSFCDDIVYDVPSAAADNPRSVEVPGPS